jgi:hypothetical protein
MGRRRGIPLDGPPGQRHAPHIGECPRCGQRCRTARRKRKVAAVVGTATIPVAITVTVNLVADHLLGLFSGFCAAAIFPLDGHH